MSTFKAITLITVDGTTVLEEVGTKAVLSGSKYYPGRIRKPDVGIQNAVDILAG
jgi:hypothetical protein